MVIYFGFVYIFGSHIDLGSFIKTYLSKFSFIKLESFVKGVSLLKKITDIDWEPLL